MSTPLIELKHVSKYFGYGVIGLARFPAVDDVSLSIYIEEPKSFTIVGESGSGKTTLAKIILRIYKPSSGTIKYRGKDLWKLNRVELRNFIKEIQPVFQDPMDTFNIFENVDNYLITTAKSLLGLSENEAIDRIEKYLNMVGLTYDKVKGKYPHEFSGGELQRISIARALLVEPKLLVADEPVSMLDASLRINILNIFRDIKQRLGASIIYITHDLATASYIGDEIYVMYRGMFIEHGNILEVLREPLHPYTKVLLEALPDYRKGRKWFEISLRQTRQSVIEVHEMMLKGCKYAYYCPYRMDRCLRERPKLVSIKKDHEVACWLYTT